MRQQLLDNLGYTYALIKENIQCKTQLDNFNRSPMDSCFTFVMSIFLSCVTINSILFFLPQIIKRFSGVEKYVSSIKSHPVAIGLVLFVVLIIGMQSLNYKLKKRNQEKNSETIEKLKNRQQETFAMLGEHSMVPKAYWNLDAIAHLYNYVENMRADTLKEALNLYELEKHQLQVSAQLQKIQSYSASAAFASWGNLIKK